MRRILLLALLLLPASFCSAQILIHPVPHAISYMFFAGQQPRAVISQMTPDEQAKFKQVYDAVLRANGDLDAEGDHISADMSTYVAALKAAMVKADSAVAPLLQQGNGSAMTRDQSDQIRQNQDAAMQADPNLQSQWDDLTKRMTEHQQKVGAAMVKLDPTVAPILAKLSP